MRKKQTFLLTILSSETGEASYCGKLKVIATGQSSNFTNLQELFDLISSEFSGGQHADLPGRTSTYQTASSGDCLSS